MTFDTFTHVIEIVALVLLFSGVIAVAVGTFLEDNSECDVLPLQHPRLTPEVPSVRLLPFDQDAAS